MSNTSVDFNNDWSYPLQYLQESEMIRNKFHQMIHKIDRAMENEAVINSFERELSDAIAKESDAATKAALEEACANLEHAVDDSLSKAIENRTTQVSTGVDRFNYTVFDPYSNVNDELNDRMASMSMRNYVESGLALLAPTFARDMDKYGICAAFVKYSDKKKCAKTTRFNPKNIWWDTRYTATGEERFRAWSKMISYRKLKCMLEDYTVNDTAEVPSSSMFIEKTKDGKKEVTIKSRKKGKKLTTLNDLDIFVEDMNRLAQNPDLQNHASTTGGYSDYLHSLDNSYNAQWYRTLANDDEARTNSLYEGDDVELTTLYDLENSIEFIIINRLFVIAATNKNFKRQIQIDVEDPRKPGSMRKFLKEVKMPCPLVFGFRNAEQLDDFPYPYSIAMKYVPFFDRIISNKSKILTTTKILSRLRLRADTGNARDIGKKMAIWGQIFTELQGDVSTLQFAYDYTPLQNQILEDKQTIIEGMNAYNMYDMMQVVGNRASSQEAGLAPEAIAQGLTPLSLAMETFYSDVTRASLMSFVVYGNESKFGVINNGEYSTVALQEMALDSIINVKTKATALVIQKRLATNILQLAATFKDMPNIDNDKWLPYAFHMASYGEIPAAIARTFVKQPDQSPQEQTDARQQAALTAEALKQNQQMYQTDPIPYEVQSAMGGMNPDEQRAFMMQMMGAGQASQAAQATQSALPASDIASMPSEDTQGTPSDVPFFNPDEMGGQDGAAVGGMPGMTDESGAISGNPNIG